MLSRSEFSAGIPFVERWPKDMGVNLGAIKIVKCNAHNDYINKKKLSYVRYQNTKEIFKIYTSYLHE